MERTLPATKFFSAPDPVAVEMPHLVTALDAELLGKMAHLTRCGVGLWNLPAPFDEEDCFDDTRETARFSAWALPLNQAEILGFSPRVREAVFGGKMMFVDARFDETTLTRLAVSPGRRLETGAWITRAYHDLPELQELVEQCHWALIPLGFERSQALFVTSRAKADWVSKLKEWCDHDGRNHGVFQHQADGLCLIEKFAPASYRRNAIGHHVDAFLSDLEIYFGTVEGSISASVEERISARRQLREKLAKLDQPPFAG
jgi:hypothetical protein